MPRTKRPVRKKERSVEQDDVLKKLIEIGNEEKKKLDARYLMECRNIEIAFKILEESIGSANLQKTVGELRNELSLKEVSASTAHQSTLSGSHDDGYLTENSAQGSGERKAVRRMAPPSSGRSTARRSRSADSTWSARKPTSTASKMTQRRRSRSVHRTPAYRTPAYNKNAPLNYPPITPKVTPQTPLTILRMPRKGEMVVSMSGSPVMVPSCSTLQQEQKANCNILLEDGTVLSLQPKELRQSEAYIPFSLMDPSTLTQIQTLKDNLEKVFKMGEKAFDK